MNNFNKLLENSPEQLRALQAARSGDSLVIEALAGTGKTTLLQIIGEDFALQGKRVLYLAFNTTIVNETRRTAGGRFDCYTGHGLAYQHAGREVVEKFKRTAGNFASDGALREALTIPGFLLTPDVTLSDDASAIEDTAALLRSRNQITHTGESGWGLTRRAITESIIYLFTLFQKSAEPEITRDLIATNIRSSLVSPWKEAGFATSSTLIDFALDKTRLYWGLTTDYTNDRLPLGHDTYLKVWQLSQPRLPYDVIMFDEAQDADRVMVDIIERQEAQVIWCGDSQQQIYSWRGAINTLSRVQRATTLPITQTQRFGSPIHEIANAFLAPLGDLRIQPHPTLESTLEYVSQQESMLRSEPVELELFRSNMRLLLRFIFLVRRGYSPRVLADLELIARLINGLIALVRKESEEESPFAKFPDLEALVLFVNKQLERGRRNKFAAQPSWFAEGVLLLRLLVPYAKGQFSTQQLDIRDTTLLEVVLVAIEKSKQDGETATSTLATAHKAKGLTADTALVHDDFLPWSLYNEGGSIAEASQRLREIRETGDPEDVASVEEEQRLCYVAVTRARKLLMHSFIIDDFARTTGPTAGINEDELFAEVRRLSEDLRNPEKTIDTGDSSSNSTWPTWVTDVIHALRVFGSPATNVEQLQYRYRFDGWGQNDGQLTKFKFDVIHNKANHPTTAEFSDGSEWLSETIHSALNFGPHGAAAAPLPLPPLTDAALRDLTSAASSCKERGVSLSWSPAAHPWQVSIWNMSHPEDVINLSFGKRGLNSTYVAKRSGDAKRCEDLHNLLMEVLTK